MAGGQIYSDNEEIRDILITISVIARRLASKLEAGRQQTQENEHEGKKRITGSGRGGPCDRF